MDDLYAAELIHFILDAEEINEPVYLKTLDEEGYITEKELDREVVRLLMRALAAYI